MIPMRYPHIGGHTYPFSGVAFFPRFAMIGDRCLNCDLGEMILEHELAHHRAGRPKRRDEVSTDWETAQSLDLAKLVTASKANMAKANKCCCPVAMRMAYVQAAEQQAWARAIQEDLNRA